MENQCHPYHEAIVVAINHAKNTEALQVLGNLITLTKTPKDHDKIIAAWEKKCKELNFRDNIQVVSKLLQQKQDEQSKPAEHKK